MRVKMVAGNWKMNLHARQAGELVRLVDNALTELPPEVRVVLCPPFPYLSQARDAITEPLALGAQDCSEFDEGAYTGQVSADMLRDIGCQYVVLGHSERRAHCAEQDQHIANKFAKAQAAGLTPILCIGETLDERDSNQTETIVKGQLHAVLMQNGVGAFRNAVVAYEPVWAIGTGLAATPEMAQDVHAMIRASIAELDVDIADNLTILYGGSVKPENAEALFNMPDIDGGLIGGAALQADSFLAICQAAG